MRRPSKRVVALLVVLLMGSLFAFGAVYRVIRPTDEDRIVDELPVYPGARERDVPASDPQLWRAYDFDEALFLSYDLPPNTSRADVFRFYEERLPKSFRPVTPACFARGEARVVIEPLLPARAALDVAILAHPDEDEEPRCPRFRP